MFLMKILEIDLSDQEVENMNRILSYQIKKLNFWLMKISDQNIGQEGKVVAVDSDKHNIGSNTSQTSTDEPNINLWFIIYIIVSTNKPNK